MQIVCQHVTSFAAVVEFYQNWLPFMVDVSRPLAGLPEDWCGRGWFVDQRGDTGTCYAVLRH